MTILAEAASPSFTAVEFYSVCGVVVFLLAAVVLVRKVFGHEPPLHKEYVTKADHDKFRGETLDELKRHAARRGEIYNEQKSQGAKLAALQTASDNQAKEVAAIRQQVGEVNDRIDSVPMRTIQLLRETQQLHHAK
jgi:hypothetical protein